MLRLGKDKGFPFTVCGVSCVSIDWNLIRWLRLLTTFALASLIVVSQSMALVLHPHRATKLQTGSEITTQIHDQSSFFVTGRVTS